MFPSVNELNNGQKRSEKYIQIHYNDFYVYLLNKYNFCDSFIEMLYCYYNDITKCPVCNFCGNKVEFISFTKGYKKFCSAKCSANSDETRNKAKKTCLKKYGTENPSKSKHIKNKITNTKTKRYNDKNFNNRNKAKQTCLERYGVENYSLTNTYKDKFKQTCLEKYGAENYSSTKECRDKVKQTCLERYGVENPFAAEEIKEKIKQTCLERYGVEYYTLTIDHKIKSRQSCTIRYNAENYTQSNNYKLRIPEIQQKIKETKDKNHTHNKSSIEEQFTSWLKNNNINFVRQYKSEQYPFFCDFYFPDTDLYFEINGTWTHGFHPFDANNKDDIRKLEKWKIKSTDYYNSAIKVWTKGDPLKVKTAKENKLNFKVVYSCKLDEVIKAYKNAKM